MATKPFVTQTDIEELAKNGNDNLDEDVKIFLTEIRQYINTAWGEEYYIEEELESLEQFNREQLENYPSYGGHMILDDTFTGPDCPTHILSYKSKGLLGYFYGIHLRGDHPDNDADEGFAH